MAIERGKQPDRYDSTLQMFAKTSMAEPDLGRLAFIRWLIQQGRMKDGGEVILGPSSGPLSESLKPALVGPRSDYEQTQ